MRIAFKAALLFAAEAVSCLALLGCGGADSEEIASADTGTLEQAERRHWRRIDHAAPTVTIASNLKTDSAGQIGLTGAAADDLRLFRVRWANDRGGSGTAALSGSTTAATWSAGTIQLRMGANKITVTAEDGAGNTAQTATILTRVAEATPASPPPVVQPPVTPTPVPTPIPAPQPPVTSPPVTSPPVNAPPVTAPPSTPAPVTPPATVAACTRSSNAWTATGVFDSRQFGNYFVQNDNWGGAPNQQIWANNENCWGVTTSASTQSNNVRSYPSVVRGWSNNAGMMQKGSTPGTEDWTTKSGMGIPISQLTKAKAHWAMDSVPTSAGSRWFGLMDIYLHRKPNPSYTEFPPVVDIMLNQSIMDDGYLAANSQQAHATKVTIGGVTYLVYVDVADEMAFHTAGGHTIHLFNTPNDGVTNWGVKNSTHDLKAIIDYFRQSNPKNDAGAALVFASGSPITSPLLGNDLYLTAVNAGYEILTGTLFTNGAFCLAMQNEADCP